MQNNGTMVLTRKIQLFINLDDQDRVKEIHKRLYQWRYICFRAANYIVTHLYLQQQIKDLFYLTEDIQVKLGDIIKGEDGIFTTSKLNTTYQMLSKNFKGEIPMNILSTLNNELHTDFKNVIVEYLKGTKVIQRFKSDRPIPVKGRDFRQWQLTEDKRNFTFNSFGIPFRTYLGKDFNDKKSLLDKMMSGNVKLCTSSIQLKDKKIYLLASFRIDKENHSLDQTVVAEATLSIDFPIIVTVGKSRYNIGTKEEFLYRRLAIQAARLRIQKAVKYNKGGKGRTKKLMALERFRDMEKNYVNSRMHLYSRMLINICIKHGASTLILVDQQAKEDAAQEDEFLLRNWSYSTLKEKISYKALKAGVNIIEE